MGDDFGDRIQKENKKNEKECRSINYYCERWVFCSELKLGSYQDWKSFVLEWLYSISSADIIYLKNYSPVAITIVIVNNYVFTLLGWDTI